MIGVTEFLAFFTACMTFLLTLTALPHWPLYFRIPSALLTAFLAAPISWIYWHFTNELGNRMATFRTQHRPLPFALLLIPFLSVMILPFFTFTYLYIRMHARAP